MKIPLSILTITLLAFQSGYGQKTILVTKDKKSVFEEYSVLASNKKVRHGSYLKLTKSFLNGYAIESMGSYKNGKRNGNWEIYFVDSNNLKESGSYKDNLRDSVWHFFYPQGRFNRLVQVQSEVGNSFSIPTANPMLCATGNYKEGKAVGFWEFFDQNATVWQKFDYDNHQLTYLRNKKIETVEAGFIGGEFLMFRYLYDSFDFNGLMKSINSKINLKTGKLTYSFTIDEMGRITAITEQVKTITNKKIIERALETIEGMDRFWYPGMKDGKALSNQKTITFDLIVEISSELRDRTLENGRKISETTTIGTQVKISIDGISPTSVY